MGEGFASLLASAAGDSDGSPAIRLLGLAIGAISLARLAATPAALRDALGRAWPLLAPVAVALLSFAWSADPAMALRRSGALALTTAFALFLVTRYDARGLIDRLLVALGLYCGLSFALIVAAPQIGVHTAAGVLFAEHVGAWRGLSPFKNDFGRNVAYAAVVFWAAALARGRGRLVFAAATAFAVALVAGSRSGQAAVLFATCAAASAALALLASFSRRERSALLLVAAPLAALVAVGADALASASLSALGKDASLTGRSEIWPVVLRALEGRMALGGGYGAGWETLAANEVYKALGRVIGHAHNGYLNLMVDVGVVGLAAAAATLLVYAGRLYAALSRGRSPELVLVAFATLLFIVAGNWVASFLMKHNSLFWVMLVCLGSELARPARLRRRAAAPRRSGDQEVLFGELQPRR
jgi:O-antigen ligase